MNVLVHSFPSFVLASTGDTGKLLLSMLVVFGCAKLMAELFERIGQPGIAGQILAGILLGPGVLAWVTPDEFLSALAELGVMFLLFRVGLEVKASELMKIGGSALLTALLGVLVPFFAGWGILYFWGGTQIEAVFVGAAMVATSVGITAEVLAAKGLLQARASRVILAAAVIDDVLGLLVLAVVSSMARGSVDVLQLSSTALLAIAFTAAVVKWGPRTLGRVVPRVDEKMRVAESQFALALLLLFALSLLAIYMGVAAIIGAFLAGMALSESVGQRVHDLTHGVSELLIPFFLVGIGLHFDPSTIANKSTLILALVVLVAAILSKFLGCGAGALGLGRADAIRVGVGMIPRGEVGMVVAGIGLRMGVIPQNVYAVVVFMAVATTMVAPPLLKLAYRDLIRPEKEQEVYHIG